MGASSSGLLDEAKISHIKGLTDSTLQSFSVFYRQQYSAAHSTHLLQEVEPKKEGKSLLLTHRPRHAPEEVLYQGNVQFSSWDERGKKGKERHIVLKGDYSLEIHDSMETFSCGSAAKLVLQPAAGVVLTTEEESRNFLEQTFPGILNGVKEDSSSVVSSPGGFPVYLHLPYTSPTCFLFTQEEQHHDFLSALKTCIRHQSLDPWCYPSYESQAFIRALRLYQQERGCYEFWEMLLGPEEKVLACQVMKEVLPWLQSQLQSRVKGKKTERMRLWIATLQATYSLVLEQLIDGLEAVREECQQSASASQAAVRSNLDQITACHSFLEDKIQAYICGPAEELCSEAVAPCLPSILETLAECVSAGIQDIQHTLDTQMDAALTHTHEGTEGLEKALSTLRSTSLDHCYSLVENLTEKLKDLKQRFRFSDVLRLVHSAQLEMEQLLDSAVYTFELFLQSARRQRSHIPTNMERAKHRVLKQLDHDSRLVQRKFYQEALLQLTLPAFTMKMDNKWKPELQQFEQYIFSDYSSFIMVQNVYDDILKDILRKEIERVVQEAAIQKSSHLLLDSSDLAISQYSLLGQTPPRSAPSSPKIHNQDSASVVPDKDGESTFIPEDSALSGTAGLCPESEPKPSLNPQQMGCNTNLSSDPNAALQSPIIIVTQQPDESTAGTNMLPPTNSTAATAPKSDADILHVCSSLDPPAVSECPGPSPVSNPSVAPPSMPPSPVAPSKQADPSDLTSDVTLQDASPPQSMPLSTHSPIITSLTSLCQIVSYNSTVPPAGQTIAQQATDRAIYLRGGRMEDQGVERVKEEGEAAEERKEEMKTEEDDSNTRGEEETEKKEKEKGRDKAQREGIGLAKTGGKRAYHDCSSSEVPAETLSTEQRDEEDSGECDDDMLESEKREEEEEEEERGERDEERGKANEEEGLQSLQPVASQVESAAAMPLDSVAVIRGLVTEVIEVETLVSPTP